MAERNSIAALSYAVRLPVLARYTGQLMLMLAGLTAVPLAVALYFAEFSVAWRFALALGGLLLIGVPSARTRAPQQIQANEALAITALSFVLASLAMIYPLMGGGLGALDAWFEAVSGVTTTGLSTLSRMESLPHSLLLARAWMQWYGGLGIVVLSVALLVGHGVAARRLVGAGQAEPGVLVTTTRLHARRMLVVYLTLTVLGFFIIVLSGIPWFDAVCHVLAAISTGGFSTHDASVAAFEGWGARGAVMLVCVCGSVSLPLYYRAYRNNWRVLAYDEEVRAFAIVAVLACTAFYVFQFGTAPPSTDRIGHALVMGLSAQTTTGFATLPVGELAPAAKVLLILAMASGGSIGSTAGGIKLLRLVLLLRLLHLMLRRLAMPAHAVAELRFADHRVRSEEIARAMLLVFLFLITVLISWIPFLTLGYNPLDALFEVVSATGTVGLSTGVTSQALAPGLKVVLIADMLLGRLEFIALLILFYPPTWFGRRSAVS